MGHRSNTLYAQSVAALERPTQSWPRWLVTGFGLGYLRPAPGSWGTAGPALVFWLMMIYRVSAVGRNVVCGAVAGVSAVLMVALGRWACAWFGKPDPGQVVLDEFCGFFISCLFLPIPGFARHGVWGAWLFTAAIFVVFRFTDTMKIPPGRQLEQLPFGWGILLDDIAAGVQANLVLQVAFRLIRF